VRGVVHRSQRALIAICTGSALLWAIATAVLVGALTTPVVGAGVALVVAAIVIWHDRAVWSAERVALWIEERYPGLDFAVVTAVDPSLAATPDKQFVDSQLASAVASSRIDPRRLLARAALRRLGLPMVGLAVSALVPVAIARYPVRRAPGHLTTNPSTRERGGVDRLARLTATVIPPRYSHLARREIAEPSEINALVGSQLIVRGAGAIDGLVAIVGTAAERVAATQDGWAVLVTMPAAPTLLRLVAKDSSSAGQSLPTPSQRLITLIPTADAPPVVELLEPARDSVMRRASGMLRLRARATDDIGLEAGHFEIVVTTGDEDEGGVNAQVLTTGSHVFGDAREGELETNVQLDSLQLSLGAVLSIRAVARDGNTITGPGVGTSDTRTFRVARADEYDSVAVESAAPSVADSSALSERVVIIGTTGLIAQMQRRPPLSRDSVAAASRRLAEQQDAVQNAITSVMSADDENELPVADVLSAPERALLDSAAYAMGEASAHLSTRAPQAALPAERRALTMVDSARSLARRVYLRSRPPRLLVDVGHVRLSGTDHPDPGPRTPGRPDTTAVHWLARLGRVGRILASTRPPGSQPQLNEARQAALDSLVVLRVEVLETQPALAAALTRTIEAIRVGRDATPALDQARTLLADPVTSATGLSPGGSQP
jgi:hypothetical protein